MTDFNYKGEVIIRAEIRLSVKKATKEQFDYIIGNASAMISNIEDHINYEIRTCGINADNANELNDDTDCAQFAFIDVASVSNEQSYYGALEILEEAK